MKKRKELRRKYTLLIKKTKTPCRLIYNKKKENCTNKNKFGKKKDQMYSNKEWQSIIKKQLNSFNFK